MSKTLDYIRRGRGIKSIVKIQDLYEITYYTRQGNIAIEQGTESQVAEILAYNEAQREPKKIQIR